MIRALARAAWGAVLDVVVPPLCPRCARSAPGPTGLCPDCSVSLDLLAEPWCPTCSLPYPGETASHPCPRCLAAPPPFRQLRAWAAYRGAAADLIQAMKYGGRIEVRSTLARWAREALERHYPEEHYDAVVPVPPARPAFLRRGFDLPGILSRAVADRSEAPWRPRALHKDPTAPDLVGRSAPDRFRETARAYRAAERLDGVVLLVDDVATTTATARAAAAACLAAGAAAVDVLVLARTPSIEPAE